MSDCGLSNDDYSGTDEGSTYTHCDTYSRIHNMLLSGHDMNEPYLQVRYCFFVFEVLAVLLISSSLLSLPSHLFLIFLPVTLSLFLSLPITFS